MNMRNIIIATAAMLCSLTATAQDRADRQQLSDPNSFSMILLGDPQGYVKYDINQPIFELTTAWCADNKEQWRAFVEWFNSHELTVDDEHNFRSWQYTAKLPDK